MKKITYNLLYVYDLTPSQKELHKIKRKFYYHLNKFSPFIKKTQKSVFLTDKAYEKEIDKFFFSFKGKVDVLKCEINSYTFLK